VEQIIGKVGLWETAGVMPNPIGRDHLHEIDRNPVVTVI
jgi:hypothetical protein